MTYETDELCARLEVVEDELETLKAQSPRMRMGVRKRSDTELFGWPLYEIAMGPDSEKNELCGHARGIIAIGDIATGFIALGGFARGVFALGGLAIGLFSFGGCALGLLLAAGGAAFGLLALGGIAVGGAAIGGAAIGYYAWGSSAVGMHTVSAMQADPQAMQFFQQWVPNQLLEALRPVRH